MRSHPNSKTGKTSWFVGSMSYKSMARTSSCMECNSEDHIIGKLKDRKIILFLFENNGSEQEWGKLREDPIGLTINNPYIDILSIIRNIIFVFILFLFSHLPVIAQNKTAPEQMPSSFHASNNKREVTSPSQPNKIEASGRVKILLKYKNSLEPLRIQGTCLETKEQFQTDGNGHFRISVPESLSGKTIHLKFGFGNEKTTYSMVLSDQAVEQVFELSPKPETFTHRLRTRHGKVKKPNLYRRFLGLFINISRYGR